MIQDMDGAMEWLSLVKVRILPASKLKRRAGSFYSKDPSSGRKMFSAACDDLAISRGYESVELFLTFSLL